MCKLFLRKPLRCVANEVYQDRQPHRHTLNGKQKASTREAFS